MQVSVLVPVKNIETVPLITSQPITRRHASEVITDDTKGVAVARNSLAELARHPILVYVDDDVRLKKYAWDLIQDIEPGVIYMTEGRNHPITRFMAITKQDFQRIGGFDPFFTCNGEDLDFYYRAKDKYIVNALPEKQILYHKPHPRHLNRRAHRESAYLRKKHGQLTPRFLVQKNPRHAFWRLVYYLYYQLGGN